MANVTTSRQFTVNLRDIARGLILGIIVAVFPVIQEAVDTWVNGGEFIINWRLMVDAAWKASTAYIALNFFSNSKLLTVPDKGEDIKDVAKRVEKVV